MKTITNCGRLFLLLFLVASLSNVSAQNSSWFKDVTKQVGGPLFDTIWNYRIYAVDVNNDDYPDLMLEYGNLSENQLRLFINTADVTGVNGRKFIETTNSSGINPPGRYADVAAIADFNNDGNVDFITNAWYHKAIINASQTACISNPDDGSNSGVRIFLGDGTGHFTMKTNSGLETLSPMSGSALPLLDYNRDGNLDVLIGTWYTGWCSLTSNPNQLVPDEKHLMKGNGDGTFTDVSSAAGDILTKNTGYFGANTADWNNDCNQDILSAPYNGTGYGNLYKNNGDGSFTDIGVTAGYNPHWLSGAGQPMVPWEAMPYDFDNDGDIDFVVPLVHGGTGNQGRTSIFVNQGAANNYKLIPELNRITRNNPQAQSKGDHKAIWMDFDNDGLVDLLISEGGYGQAGERLYFERQDSLHHFNDITQSLGWINGNTISPEIRGSHAVEPIDFDLDGDDDIVVGCLYSVIKDKRFLFLENKIGNTNNWIKIKLAAPPGVNRSCIGARITVKAGGVTQMRDIYAGQGHFGGQQPFALNFGLKNNHIDTIIVRWPDASCSQTLITKPIPVNRTITIGKNGIVSANSYSKAEIKFEIFPNPNNGEFNISISGLNKKAEGLTIQVMNMFGQVIASYHNNPVDNYITSISLPDNIPSGTYFLKMKNGVEVYNEKVSVVK